MINLKIPLAYQVSEYDCGSTSLLNVFSYLFEREEIPAIIVKSIYSYAMDETDSSGNVGQGGTSRESMQKLVMWLTEYAKNFDFDIISEYFSGEEVTLDILNKYINFKAVILVRCYQNVEHYILIINIDEKYAYVWDPTYVSQDNNVNDDAIEFIFDKPFSHNRIIKLGRLFEDSKNDFSFLSENNREMVIFQRKLG